jgi:hypothetical protein
LAFNKLDIGKSTFIEHKQAKLKILELKNKIRGRDCM